MQSISSNIFPPTPAISNKTLQQIFDDRNEDELLEYIEAKQLDPLCVKAKSTVLLHEAAIKNWCKVIKLLITNGEYINRRSTHSDPNRQWTALQFAIYYKNREACYTLVDLGANLNDIYPFGDTHLLSAIKFGDQEIINFIFDRTDNQTMQTSNNKGYCPLMCASEKNYEEIVRKLLDRGADPNARTNDGLTALDFAVEKKNQSSIDLLLPVTNKFHNPLTHQNSTLHIAVRKNLPNVCETLLNRGADPYHRFKDGLTPYETGVHLNQKKCAEMVFQKMDKENQLCADYLFQQRLFINRFHAAFNIKVNQSRIQILVGFSEVSYKEIQESLALYISKNLKLIDPIYTTLSTSVIWPHSIKPVEQFLNLSDKILVISGRWALTNFGHETTIVITNKYLFLCDRGVRQERGITIYEILDQEELQKLFVILNERNEVTEQFLRYQIDDVPYLKQIKIIKQRTQRIGNCVWVSPKSVVFALFIAALAKNNEILDETVRQAKQHYKEWSELDRGYGSLKFFTHPYHQRQNKESEPTIPTVEKCLIEAQMNLGPKSRIKWARRLRQISDCCGVDHQISPLKWNILEGDFKKASQEDHDIDVGGYSLLHLASIFGEEELVKKLAGRGSDVFVQHKVIPTPTHLALHLKNYGLVKFLREPVLNFEIKDNKGKTLFFLACEHNQTELACDLISRGADPLTHDAEKHSALMHVAKHGNVVLAEEIASRWKLNLIDQVNEQNNDGYTALHYAASNNHSLMCEFLLAHGAKLSIVSKNAHTPLDLAYCNDHSELTELLIGKSTPDILNCVNSQGYTIFHFSSIKGDLKICELLHKKGANIKIATKSGDTPLIKAINNGFPNLAAWLLKHLDDDDLKHTNEEGLSAFHLAAIYNNQDICQQLLMRGVSPLITPVCGYTPLHFAMYNGHIELTKWLLKEMISRDMNLNLANDEGITLVHQATSLQDPEICKLLLQHKASPNVFTNSGLTPLLKALFNNNVEAAELLIHELSTAELDYAEPFNKNTALHAAANNNHHKICEILIKRGVYPNPLNSEESPPLMVALWQGHIKLAEWLMGQLSDEDLCHANRKGMTALHIAASKNQESICKSLIERGFILKSITSKGNTPLILALENDHWNLAKWMIEQLDKETLDMATSMGNTAFHIAAKNNQWEICRLLKERGADLMAVNIFKYHPLVYALLNFKGELSSWFVDILEMSDLEQVDRLGRNALHTAVANNHKNIVIRLFERAVKTDAVTNKGESVLHIAIEKNHVALAEWLIEKLDPKILDHANIDGITPFLDAAWGGHLDICKLLIKKQVNTHAISPEKKNTALHIALYQGHFDVAELLINTFDKEQLNYPNHAGVTPLHIAALWNQGNLCRLLIERGANPEAFTARGNTPRSLALNNGHFELADMLKPSEDTYDEHLVMCRKLASLDAFDHSPSLLALMHVYSPLGESYLSKIEDEELIRMKLTRKMPWFIILVNKSEKFSEMLLSRGHIFNYIDSSMVLMLTQGAIQRSHKSLLELILKLKGESFFSKDILEEIKSILKA